MRTVSEYREAQPEFYYTRIESNEYWHPPMINFCLFKFKLVHLLAQSI